MSEMIALGFEDRPAADAALQRFTALQKMHLLDIRDAAIVTRNEKHKVKISQMNNLVVGGAVRGGFWGLLLGLVFVNPLVGLATGVAAAGLGALAGKSTDIGIDDDFMKLIGEHLTPGHPVLFLLLDNITPDKVLEELRGMSAVVIRTSLTHADEAILRTALGEHAELAQSVFDEVRQE